MASRGALVALAGAALLLPAAPASAQQRDPTLYCEGDGGPAGMATDAEHSVLVGDPPLPRGVRSSNVSVGGVQTRVLEAGPPKARDAVVFVHGSPGSSRDYDALMAAAGRFARAVSFDVSGYGKSDKSAARLHSTRGVAEYLEALRTQLGIRRVILGLHDFGGAWGLEWAVKHPESFRGALLLNTGALIDYVPHPLAIEYFTPGVGEATMATTVRENFRAVIQAQNPRPLPLAFIDRMYDDFDRATRCAALRYYRSAFDNPWIGRQQAEALRPRNLPALVIWGEDDPYIPVQHAEQQRQAFPRAKIVIYPDTGHWPFVDEPARTLRDAMAFLRPTLIPGRPRVSRNRRRVRLRVRVSGVLPAHRVRARLARRGSRRSRLRSRPRAIERSAALMVRSRRPLAAGRYVATVAARGIPARRVRFRLR